MHKHPCDLTDEELNTVIGNILSTSGEASANVDYIHGKEGQTTIFKALAKRRISVAIYADSIILKQRSLEKEYRSRVELTYRLLPEALAWVLLQIYNIQIADPIPLPQEKIPIT